MNDAIEPRPGMIFYVENAEFDHGGNKIVVLKSCDTDNDGRMLWDIVVFPVFPYDRSCTGGHMTKLYPDEVKELGEPVGQIRGPIFNFSIKP